MNGFGKMGELSKFGELGELVRLEGLGEIRRYCDFFRECELGEFGEFLVWYAW